MAAHQNTGTLRTMLSESWLQRRENAHLREGLFLKCLWQYYGLYVGISKKNYPKLEIKVRKYRVLGHTKEMFNKPAYK